MNRTTRPTVLVVEDDRFALDLAEEWLSTAGYLVKTCVSGRDAESLLEHETVDLVVLDLGLPGLDGMELLKRIRAVGSQVGVVIVSGRTAEPDRIRGLREGADDYLSKPYSPGELLARVEAVLRRTAGDRLGVVTTGDLKVDLDARTVEVDGEAIELTRTEFDLLAVLVSNQGRAITKANLLAAVWNRSPSPSGFALLQEYMSRLRKRCLPTQLATVRGVGYRFDP